MKSKRLLLMLLLALLVPWAANAQTLTVCDGTTTSDYVPVYGYNADTQGNQTEFIIPSTDLSAMVGKDITKMTFFLSGTGNKVWGGNWQVYVKEVENTTFSTPYAMNGPTGAFLVYEGGLNASGTMDVEFENYYNYQGGNLLIGFTYKRKAFGKLGAFMEYPQLELRLINHLQVALFLKGISFRRPLSLMRLRLTVKSPQA